MLRNRGIVVTRPRAQADPFCEALAARGARVLRFPALQIGAASETHSLRAVRADLGDYACVIFVSINAVQRGLPLLLADATWPAGVLRAAIGARTAMELAQWQHAAQIVPNEGFDSETLLQEPLLQDVAGKRILIVRGEGGRELLGTTLRARGALVDYAEVYRREPANSDPALFFAWLAAEEIDAITVTSGETLRMLLTILEEPMHPGQGIPASVFRTALIVGASRVGEYARSSGFTGPITAASNPSDEAMLCALETFFAAES